MLLIWGQKKSLPYAPEEILIFDYYLSQNYSDAYLLPDLYREQELAPSFSLE